MNEDPNEAAKLDHQAPRVDGSGLSDVPTRSTGAEVTPRSSSDGEAESDPEVPSVETDQADRPASASETPRQPNSKTAHRAESATKSMERQRRLQELARTAEELATEVTNPAGTPDSRTTARWRNPSKWIAERKTNGSKKGKGRPYEIEIGASHGVQVGDGNTQINVFAPGDEVEADFNRARKIFIDSLKHREQFIGSFLKQALRQADATFRLSFIFMTAGGLIILVAATLALMSSAGTARHSVALVSGLGGVLVGTSGAAFSLRADRARKHLASQAERMHAQLIDERRFTQVIDILGGIKNEDLNDKTRMALALRLMEARPDDANDLESDPRPGEDTAPRPGEDSEGQSQPRPNRSGRRRRRGRS